MEQKNYKLAVALRHEIHKYPDLSLYEQPTVARIIGFLKQHAPTLEIHDKGRWLYAVYRAKSPRGSIAFRCEIDALPIDEPRDMVPYASTIPHVSHKCGHDGHAATMAGFAIEVAQKGCDKDVYFLFQHAEEIGFGAFECTEMLRENKIDEIYAYHNAPGMPLGAVESMIGTYYDASKGMTIAFTGKPSHAGEPEKGINPAFAIADIVHMIPDFVKPGQYEGLVMATIIQIDVGEPAFGTQAHKGKLLLTIRGEHESEMDDLQRRLERLAQDKAKEFGMTCEFSYCDYFPETANTEREFEKVRDICAKIGRQFITCETPYRGSEDFGHLTKLVPGCIFEMGDGEDYPDVHTWQFDFNDKLIPLAVEVYWELVRS